jgi:hypothetical protein
MWGDGGVAFLPCTPVYCVFSMKHSVVIKMCELYVIKVLYTNILSYFKIVVLLQDLH